MKTCVDSSFLVSSYIPDIHSVYVDQRMANIPEVVLTTFNRAEFANAIYQQVFLKRMALSTAYAVFDDFENDCLRGLWKVVEVPSSVWERCVQLAPQYGAAFGVRMLDMLHVACALELGAKKFWTFDERQERLAIATGLDTAA